MRSFPTVCLVSATYPHQKYPHSTHRRIARDTAVKSTDRRHGPVSDSALLAAGHQDIKGYADRLSSSGYYQGLV